MARSTHAVQKERIHRKAAQLFAKNGYEGTGVQELSEAVGLGRGALYYHIGSKEQLLAEISTVRGREMIAFGEAVLAEDIPSAEKVRRLSEDLLETLAMHLPEWTVFHRDGSTAQGKVRAEIIEIRDRFEQLWLELLREGVESGEFREVDPIAVKGILGMHNYAYLWMRERGRLTPKEIAAAFWDLLMRGLQTTPQGASGK
jgi:AcrR family transcriptional regulator